MALGVWGQYWIQYEVLDESGQEFNFEYIRSYMPLCVSGVVLLVRPPDQSGE